MNLYLVMKLLHFLAAFWFISGIVGQNLAFWQQSDERPGGSCVVAGERFLRTLCSHPGREHRPGVWLDYQACC
jgi:hypothetical protein